MNALANHDRTTTEQDPRWVSVVTRDRSAAAAFVYSVRTTGVYCRPSCGARRALPENVRFHDTAAEAEACGFRPCKRCRPDRPADEAAAAAVAKACRRIEQAETPPTLDRLAAEAGLSPFHFHRVFKAATGVTPKAYALAQRANRVRTALAHSRTVTEAIYDAGYNSNGRFYDESDSMLGMTPTAFRAGGADAAIRFAVGPCSLGSVLVAASPKGICAILIGDDAETLLRDLQDRFPKATLVGSDADFEALVGRVIGLVEAPGLAFDLPLDVRGTAFQQQVWQALRQIPVGATSSYTEIATRIGHPKAVRAVAQACAANPIAVAIPCHRVIRTDGAVSGYRWGIERKRILLARERDA